MSNGNMKYRSLKKKTKTAGDSYVSHTETKIIILKMENKRK